MASEAGPRTGRGPASIDEPMMREIATLPVFYRLQGKRVAVIGGSRAAGWKVELLAAAGAQVNVFAETFEPHIEALAAQLDRVVLERRRWTPSDLDGAALAIAECEEEDEARALQQAARSAGVHLNIIDKPQWSAFQFGAIVERSPLVLAISTDGGAPVFGQSIRARIETLLPDGFRHWARAAKAWRSRVAALGLDLHGRRKVWEAFARRALAHPERAPDESDLEAILRAGEGLAGEGLTPAEGGSVLLVGAGPGDPELLTLRAVRALQDADVVLFDDLVSPGVLDMARREAEKISVGKRGFKPSCTQEDICALLVDLARQGKRVVRLKGGDPMVFGRASEEIDALRDAGVPVGVVPGVTAASAAAAALNLSLTERTQARRLQFVTAHARGGQLPDDLDWKALADPLAATVIYMGVRTLPDVCARLAAEGLPEETPAVLVERASAADQRQIFGTLATLPGLVATAGVKGPALTIIGQMVRERL